MDLNEAFAGSLTVGVLADILVHAVKVKPIIKAQISGKLITSGISDVAIASVYF